MLLAATDGASARGWELGSGRVISEFQHGKGLRLASYSPNEKLVVTAGEGAAKIWDASDEPHVLEEIPCEGRVTSAVFSPDSKRVLFTVAGQARLGDRRQARLT